MLEQGTKKRTIKKIEVVTYYESIYTTLHQKSTGSLRILKRTYQQLSSVHLRGKVSHIVALLLEIYQKIWQASSNRILRLQDNRYFFLTLRERTKQFEERYKESMSNISQAEKDINAINIMHQEMEKVYHDYQKPTKYYDNIERIKLKKQLKDHLEKYLIKKREFMIDYPSKKKMVVHLNHMSDYFNKQIDEGLAKGLVVINKIEDGFLSGIRQFIYYLLDTCARQVTKLKTLQVESHWSFEFEELKKQNLDFLNKLRDRDFGENLEPHFQKYFKFCKQISKQIEEQIKQSEMVNTQMKNMIEVLNSAKRQIEKQIQEVDLLKEKLVKYCIDPQFLQSYKVTLSQTIQIIKFNITNISSNYELSKGMEKLNNCKKDVNIKTKIAGTKQIPKNSQQLIAMYEGKLDDLQNMFKLQNETNKITKEGMIQNFSKFLDDIRSTEVNLLSMNKQIRKNRAQPKITKTNLERQIVAFDLLNDELLEKEIIKSLQQFPIFTKSDEENPDKVYNCTLGGGKMPLFGELKLYPEIILFQSNFNKKNLFFGKTNLVIPKDDIIEVTKEAGFLTSNGVNINTKKGMITLTTFYNRDKAFEEINEYLTIEDEEQNNNNNNQSFASQISKAEVISPEDIEIISNKKQSYSPQLFTPYNVSAGSRRFEKTTLKKIFTELYSSKNEILKKKQKFTCFKQYALLSTQNQSVIIGALEPPPPSYFDSTSTTKLSTLTSSERISNYNHLLGSMPIPFMPKFGVVTEKERFNWISDKMIIIEGENLTTKAPYSDTFVLRFKTVIEQINEGVTITATGMIEFVKSTAFQSIIKSTGEKQIVKNTEAVLELGTKHMQELKKKRVGKVKGNHPQQEEAPLDEEIPTPQNPNDGIQKLHNQNKRNMMILSFVFALVLILTHILF